ncbi:MarR family transcriptional regulator [Saxibacter everestensis]|uniref:MarR family transcriptional regulator n=1 Tax=Saxibacter everestensis TaxID=2909229 RepID=A0ABY8QU58_9MICO|nr:MarR family transcriptional regulator [Brevibacteriaceae bacterium ZFBP1038]
MIPSRTGYELPFLLLGAFRRMIDELHRELANAGHPDLRPVHAVAMQTIADSGSQVNEMAASVGVSKQAMAKTVAKLEELGYVRRTVNRADRRARVVSLTERGTNALACSGEILVSLAQAYADSVGEADLLTTTDVLRKVRGDAPAFEQLIRWFGDD